MSAAGPLVFGLVYAWLAHFALCMLPPLVYAW